jgi:hypothetical protein
MTAPAQISSEYDNTRLEQAFWTAATRATGYRRALINYALSVASNLPADPNSALASRGTGNGIGDGSPADLKRLARELQAGLDAFYAGVLELEHLQRGTRHGPQPADRQAPATAQQAAQQATQQPAGPAEPAERAATETGPSPSGDVRRDFLRLAGQAARVQNSARRAARDLSPGTSDRRDTSRGAWRSLMTALGMALLRAGLALSDPGRQTPGAHPAGVADMDRYVGMALRRHLDQMRGELALTSARLDHLSQQRGTAPGDVGAGRNGVSPFQQRASTAATPRLVVPGRAGVTGPATPPVEAHQMSGSGSAPRPASPGAVLRMELAGAGQHTAGASGGGEIGDQAAGVDSAPTHAGSTTHHLDGLS